ncbi:hypothetical protein [Timonella sp. A28]
MSSLIVAAAESEVVNQLPISPVAYGVITFCALFATLLVTYAFKSVHTRH